MQHKHLHEENRRAWNAATEVHNTHKADQARFLREGGSTLFPEEIELLGDVSGLSLVHLQCNAGQDSPSLAARGATVTGVDISDTAVEFARRLSAESGIPATFHRMDVYDWLAQAGERGEQYDVAFSSYGALCWLSDIQRWARGVAGILRPGGRLVVVEFHPVAMLFEEDWSRRQSYFADGETISFEEGIGDYVGWTGPIAAPSGYLEGVTNFRNPHPGHEYLPVDAFEAAIRVLAPLDEIPELLACVFRFFDSHRSITPCLSYVESTTAPSPLAGRAPGVGLNAVQSGLRTGSRMFDPELSSPAHIT